MLTEGDRQLVFLDTPGVVDLDEVKRFKLENSLLVHPEESCSEADIILGTGADIILGTGADVILSTPERT